MAKSLRPAYQEYINDSNTLGILVMEEPKLSRFDGIVLIVVSDSDQPSQVEHYEIEGRIIAVNVITEGLLMEWIGVSGYDSIIEWIIYGEKVFERDDFIQNLKEQARDLPQTKRDLLKTMVFGRLMKSYDEAKGLYESSQYKDANNKMFYSLYHLARLAVIEKWILSRNGNLEPGEANRPGNL